MVHGNARVNSLFNFLSIKMTSHGVMYTKKHLFRNCALVFAYFQIPLHSEFKKVVKNGCKYKMQN